MTDKEILQHVDHTLLKAFASWEDMKRLCEESLTLHTASVCVPPAYVKRIHDTFGEKINICTVIGFPLGYSTSEAKITEAETAIRDGAGEIDMVINIGDLKNGRPDRIEEEIKALRTVCRGLILKVIIETCYLSEAEKIAMCGIVTESGADYIKTSTGFGTGGASVGDVRLFRKHIGQGVKIKAAGGIRTKEDMRLFLEEGCERIGTSSAGELFLGRQG